MPQVDKFDPAWAADIESNGDFLDLCSLESSFCQTNHAPACCSPEAQDRCQADIRPGQPHTSH